MKEIRREYWSNGKTWTETYLINGKRHREDGPAKI